MQASANLNIMIKEVRAAERIVHRDFVEIQSLQGTIASAVKFAEKSRARVAACLEEALKEARPNYGYAATGAQEEKGNDPTRRWRVAPLFGAVDFARGLPHWGLSIGLEHKGQMVTSVVYMPVFDELYCAEKGTGAWLNDRRTRTSNQIDLDHAVVAASISTRTSPLGTAHHQKLSELATRVAGLKTGLDGAAALCQVAAGRLDGFFTPQMDAHDCAAASMIAQEAGAMTTIKESGEENAPQASILAAPSDLFDSFSKVLSA